jgi:hypothetical protein
MLYSAGFTRDYELVTKTNYRFEYVKNPFQECNAMEVTF